MSRITNALATVPSCVANTLAHWRFYAALRFGSSWNFVRRRRFASNAKLTPRARQIHAALKTAIAHRLTS